MSSIKENCLITQETGSVRVLIMNRPRKRNALNTELTQNLMDALEAAAADDHIAAIVLAANGPDFCAGADISEFSGLTENSELIGKRADLTAALHKKFSEINKPIIGAAQGNMMGGGAGLAMACDMLITSETAMIGYPEIKLGIVPAIVMANLVRQIGPKKAFELVITGKPIDAEQALEYGISNHMAPADRLLQFTIAIAHDIAKRNIEAITAIKSLFYGALDCDYSQGIELGKRTNIKMRGFNKP